MDILKISVLGTAGGSSGDSSERPRTGVCKPCYDGNRSCDTGISCREDQLPVPVSGETETESSD